MLGEDAHYQLGNRWIGDGGEVSSYHLKGFAEVLLEEKELQPEVCSTYGVK